MIDAREKLPDIALQDPYGTGIVTAYLPIKSVKTPDSPMGSLPYAARVRIGNKRPIKKWIKDAINAMVEQTIADARFMDVPWLRVGDFESLIAAVAVQAIDNIKS